MKFTLSWLEDHLATKADRDEILGFMMKAGLEVEEVVSPADKLAAFTVAKVREAVPHPDADKLRICTVDTVDGEKQIVCGAPNARAGMSAIYAPLGAYIPGADFSLDKKPRKIRGVESHGMLCSAKELEAGDDHDGIIDLKEYFEVGVPAAIALAQTDTMIDFEVTPNRPDWLGVSGIARDLAAAGAGRFIGKPAKAIDGGYDCPVDIEIEASDVCPVFTGLMITGVKNGPSPDWMQARLKAVGIQPKSLLVDVTNYVSLDQARPLHAYDAAKLKGPVTARLGQPGEKLEALDGKTYELTEEMCVIADKSGAIGLGGVMGGESTAVSEETTDIFLESAWFDPLRTARTGRVTGIISDARYRFERGVDPRSCLDGLYQAARIIIEQGGGDISRPVIAGEPPTPHEKVTFHTEDVARLTGLDVKPADMKKMLKALGCEIEDAGVTWYVTPPSWRFDIEQSADFVEEIARLTGYDALAETPLPPLPGGRRAVTTPIQSRVRASRRALAAQGFLEAVTWSFMSKEHAALFSGAAGGAPHALTIANPVASDLDQMRPSLLGNLAQATQRASDHGARGVKLFEAGPAYLGDGAKDQRTMIAALVRPAATRHWKGAQAYDVYDAKADLYALLQAIGQPPERFQISEHKAGHFHPGQAAALKLGPKVTIAHFGALHPRVLKAMKLDGPLIGFELNLNALPQMKTKPGKTKPLFEKADLTPIRRDLAFIVPKETPAGDLIRLARGADKALIAAADVFDVYEGPGIDEDKKSIAFEITIQPRGEALKDADIDAIMKKVIGAVEKGTGGSLRA